MEISILEQLVANLTGKVERKTLNGRECLVAPVSMMTPGVRAGSQGPLLYRDGLAENHDVWNGIPIVLRHPTDKDGNPVSARDPEVLNGQWLGNVYGSQGDGKLTGHAWFDVQALTNADAKLPDSQKIMPRLLKGEPIEISTGLYTRNKEAPGVWNDGTRYTHEVVAATPDHLAVLPDQKGACSVADGCGINVNQRASAVSRLFRFLGVKLGLIGNQEPSDDLSMSPEKACQILKDGHANGQPLSEDQRGMFGALCGETKNEEAPVTGNDDLPWDECIRKMAAEGHTGEHAQEICGAIKAGTANQELPWGECVIEVMANDGLDRTAAENLCSQGEGEAVGNERMCWGRPCDGGGESMAPDEKGGGGESKPGEQTHKEVPDVVGKLAPGADIPKASNLPPRKDATSKKKMPFDIVGYLGKKTSNIGDDMKIPAQAVTNLKRVLTANCKCGGAEKAANNKALADEVVKLKDKIQTDALNRGAKAVLNIQQGQLVINAEGEAAGVDIAKLAKFLAIDINPGSDPAGFIKSLLAKLDEISKQLSQPEDLTDAGADEGSETPPPVAMAEGGPDATTANGRQTVSNLTAEEREDIAWARAEKVKQKQAIVNRLLANSSATDAQKQGLAKNLMAKSLVELTDLALLAPPAQVENQQQDYNPGHWVGMTGNANPVLTRNQSQVSDRERAEIEAMTPPVLNFRKERQKQSA